MKSRGINRREREIDQGKYENIVQREREGGKKVTTEKGKFMMAERQEVI